MSDTRMEAVRVYTRDLPKATSMMNWREGGAFSCRVTNIIPEGETSIVILEKEGSYPFKDNQWKHLITPLRTTP